MSHPRSSPQKARSPKAASQKATNRKATSQKGTRKPPDNPGAAALAASADQRRLTALERRRTTLASKIARRRTELARFEDGCRELSIALLPRLEPLFERGQAADAEIHAMFQEILTTRKLGKRSYKAILEVYQTLQDEGLISLSSFEYNEPGQGSTQLDFSGSSGKPDDTAVSPEPGPPEPDDDTWNTPPAEPRQGPGARSDSLRDIFLQLASQFHPDLATDAELQRRNTEIMKELNRAYRAGDAARLLEMERELDARGTVELQGELSWEQRCARLEEQIELLEEQLRALDEHLASQRDSLVGALSMEYRRLRKERAQDPVGVLLQDIEEQLSATEEIADFVRQFRDGKMSIKRFLEGPPGLSLQLDEQDLLAILEDGELIEIVLRSRF